MKPEKMIGIGVLILCISFAYSMIMMPIELRGGVLRRIDQIQAEIEQVKSYTDYEIGCFKARVTLLEFPELINEIEVCQQWEEYAD